MQGNRGKFRHQTVYDNVQKLVETGHVGKVTVLWNQLVRTDRTVPNYNLDIINLCLSDRASL